MSQMNTSLGKKSPSGLRRRPSIHRHNYSNLTDDQKSNLHPEQHEQPENVTDSETEESESEDQSDTQDNESNVDAADEEEDIYSKVGSNRLDNVPYQHKMLYTPEGITFNKNYRLTGDNSVDETDDRSFQKLYPKSSESQKPSANNVRKTPLLVIIVKAALGILVAAVGIVVASNMIIGDQKLDMNTIKEHFPDQDDLLWLAFKSGVSDVIIRNRPSTFIFLYKEEAQSTLTNLLHQLSKYATCTITECSKKPIIISDTELNSARIIKDYGTLIEDYKDKLEERGVMIIKNLERVRGTSAQAFHSLCDEFTPLVAKSLFIFTMKVDELPNSNSVKFVEDFLKSRWTDVKIDALNALITRITSMVVEIRP